MKNTIPLAQSKTVISHLPLAIMAQLPPQPRIFGPTDKVQLKSIRTSGTQPPPLKPHPLRNVRRRIGRTDRGCCCSNQCPHQPVGPPPLCETHIALSAIMGETFTGPYNDNMNFQLKHLMREQLCVHNTITWECVSKELQRGPLRSGLCVASK